jgi:hypothetical protein
MLVGPAGWKSKVSAQADLYTVYLFQGIKHGRVVTLSGVEVKNK